MFFFNWNVVCIPKNWYLKFQTVSDAINYGEATVDVFYLLSKHFLECWPDVFFPCSLDFYIFTFTMFINLILAAFITLQSNAIQFYMCAAVLVSKEQQFWSILILRLILCSVLCVSFSGTQSSINYFNDFCFFLLEIFSHYTDNIYSFQIFFSLSKFAKLFQSFIIWCRYEITTL